MAKTIKHPTTEEMLGPLPPVRARKVAFDPQVQALRNYLANFFPSAIVMPGDGYETTVHRTIELLDKLREYQRAEAADHKLTQERLNHARANAVKGAIAALISRYQEYTVDELKQQACAMIGDDRFWQDLSTLGYSQQQMKKLLGPYAY